jgi:hypothetical protein
VKDKILVISLLFFGLSLTQTAVRFIGYAEANSYSSLAMLLTGAVSVLGGGLLEWLIWLANPLYFYALACLDRGESYKALFISLIALAIALSFRFWQTILVSESGRVAPISSFGAGYYLWLASIGTLFVGAAYLAFRLAIPAQSNPSRSL